jgi:hypothetical protein
MFLYQVLLVAGALGLVAMALMGFIHHGGPDHGSHAGHGHQLGHGHHGGHLGEGAHIGHVHHGGHLGDSSPIGHLHHAGHLGDAHAGHAADPGHLHGGAHSGGHASHDVGHHGGLAPGLLSLLSPMTLFSGCLGAGAVGSVLTGWGVPAPVTAAGAAAGAVGFNALLVRPMMRLVMGFASTPARGLAGTLMQRAEAITRFDANGEGLVRVLVDGQSVDVLARLTEEERRQGARVLRGQSVLVEEVDGRSNRCTVSRL